jgi:hypothetical protein
MPMPPRPAADRFWEKVSIGGPDECWVWSATRTKDGYGVLIKQSAPKRLIHLAHRLSWELHHGPIPGKLHVLHRCDNPPCVNPSHLWLGTQADNNRDRDSKERGGAKGGHVADRRGVKNGNAKLSDAQVLEIIAKRAEGWSQQSIADEYGVGQSQISRIVRGIQRA